eukprot:TRINITY_DN8803_c0_g1_i1.p1 TRINITY_DN8803_c0_g1~~TRINITY_DN8803_c0_g1_i1.p1  ORF type:complete len:303 (+),score=40.45 TRINITY_DN8803_c0_g1_i1:44-910(+)
MGPKNVKPPGKLRRAKEAMSRRPRVVAATIAVIILMLLVKRWDFCWGARPRMEKLYDATITSMEEIGVKDWWLDYGTLLGAIRDKSLLEHEYDLDFGITYEQCEKMTSKKGKEIFLKRGLLLYSDKDHISEKQTLTYDTVEKKIKIATAYLGVGCARAYGPSGYFVDFYPYVSLTPDQVNARAPAGNFTLFPVFSMDGTPYPSPIPASPTLDSLNSLACTPLGLLKEEQFDGGCFLHHAVWPLKPHRFLDKDVLIPNQPEVVLREAYGNTWVTPITKGIRGPLCYLHT